MGHARACLAWPEEGTALVPPMLPQPLALACAGSRAVRGEPAGRGPRDIELKLASARPHAPSRPFTMPGRLAPGRRGGITTKPENSRTGVCQDSMMYS